MVYPLDSRRFSLLINSIFFLRSSSTERRVGAANEMEGPDAVCELENIEDEEDEDEDVNGSDDF